MSSVPVGGGRFQKGFDSRRNRNGRPLLGRSVKDLFLMVGDEDIPAPFLEKLRNKFPGMKPDEHLMHALVRVIFSKALAGDAAAIACVLDRAYGRPVVSVDMDPDGGLTRVVEQIVCSRADGNAAVAAGTLLGVQAGLAIGAAAGEDAPQPAREDVGG
jgi:hypothetical protein